MFPPAETENRPDPDLLSCSKFQTSDKGKDLNQENSQNKQLRTKTFPCSSA